MIGFFSILAIGFFLGMRHATDPDHVVAVTTIVSRQSKLSRAALTGLFWGIGHTLTILVVGAAIILFGIVIPARIGLSMEFSVALMLIFLGIINVVAFMRSGVPHSHPHTSEDTPSPAIDRIFAGFALYRHLRPLLIGIVHGLAGSAAVALLVLATIRDARWAIAYLLLFGIGTVAGMMLITMSIASAFSYFGGLRANFGGRLAFASGLISLGFGLLLVYQIGFANGLLTGHPQWTPR
ncbi:MAG: high-affinity nickel-transport family protein [Terriglobales bacterium]